MAESREVELSEEAKRAIKKYLTRFAIAGATAFGILNVLSLVTVVPNLAASRVTESEAIKKVRDDALVAGGALQESLRRARQGLDDSERALKDINDKVEAFKRTDTSKLAERAAALESLGADSQKILDAVVAIRAEIPRVISLGPEHYMDYEKLDHSFDKKCPEGMVATGWGYGSRNNDARFFCRPVTLGR